MSNVGNFVMLSNLKYETKTRAEEPSDFEWQLRHQSQEFKSAQDAAKSAMIAPKLPLGRLKSSTLLPRAPGCETVVELCSRELQNVKLSSNFAPESSRM